MSLQQYSGGPNPFLELSKIIGRMGRKKPEQVQSEALMHHMAATQQTHEHAVNLLNAHYSAASNYMKDVNKQAEPGTPVTIGAGSFTSTHVKKTSKIKEELESKKTHRPLPVRDPKTGRAMRAPD
jgi:hypothetical protein